MYKQYTPWVGRGRIPRLTHGVYCLFIQNSGIIDLCYETIVVIHSLCCINCIYWDAQWNPFVAIITNTSNKYAFSFHHWPQWVTLQVSYFTIEAVIQQIQQVCKQKRYDNIFNIYIYNYIISVKNSMVYKNC